MPKLRGIWGSDLSIIKRRGTQICWIPKKPCHLRRKNNCSIKRYGTPRSETIRQLRGNFGSARVRLPRGILGSEVLRHRHQEMQTSTAMLVAMADWKILALWCINQCSDDLSMAYLTFGWQQLGFGSYWFLFIFSVFDFTAVGPALLGNSTVQWL